MSTRLLHLDSSITGPASVSRALSATVVATLRAADPTLEVAHRDLAAAPLPHLDGARLAADLAVDNDVLDEFLAADIVVIGVGFYNFGVPSQLKAWVDRIAVRGKTFSYTEAGPKGLAGDKRVVLAIARGGFYGPGSPVHAYEHAETYLRNVFGFLGVTRIDVVSAEGMAVPALRQAGIEKAEAAIAELAGA